MDSRNVSDGGFGMVHFRPRVIIVGGGFNGRLLQAAVPSARVFDWRDAKPEKDARQFGPQYLWEPLAGFTCHRFLVTTLVDNRRATEAAVLRYKKKVSKELDGGDWRAQFTPRMDGWSVTLPLDTVEYGRRIAQIDVRKRYLLMSDGQTFPYDYLLSTIPLFALLGLIKTPGYVGIARQLKYRPIYFSVAPMSTYQRYHPAMWQRGMRVNYVGDPLVPWYRETWRDGEVFRESLVPAPGAVKFVPGKIYPCAHVPDALATLRASGIWTFGRFANWASDELAHETYTRARAWAFTEGLREGM